MPQSPTQRRTAPSGRGFRRLGRRIRTLRERAGLTQTQLGEPHVSRSGVSRIEAGDIGPTFATLMHFARRLRVRVRDLIPDDL